MNIQKGDLITLSNDKQYLVVSKLTYNNDNYLYLVDINNNTNIKFVYEKKELDKIKVVVVKDETLIKHLALLIYKDIIKN